MDLGTYVEQIISSRFGIVQGYMRANQKESARIYVVWDDGGMSAWYYEIDFKIVKMIVR